MSVATKKKREGKNPKLTLFIMLPLKKDHESKL